MSGMGQQGRLYLAVGCGAAIGSLLRYFVGAAIASTGNLNALWATVFVNIVGSFIIMTFATLTGPDGRWLIGPVGRQFMMSGLCGGFTTFSAMSLDAFLLLHRGDTALAMLYLAGTIIASLTAAWFGYWFAKLVNH